MTIFRKPHHRRYTCISNQLAQDNNLSLRARGLMLYFLSLPDDWKISVTHLVSVMKEGRDQLKNIIRELKDAGYIYLTKEKFQGESVYHIYEEPINAQEFKKSSTILLESSQFVNPQLQSTKKSSYEDLDKDKVISAPPPGAPSTHSKRKKKEKIQVAPNVHLTEQEMNVFKKIYGEEKFNRFIKRLDKWKLDTGKSCRNDAQAIRGWVIGAVENDIIGEQNVSRTLEKNKKGIQEIYDFICRMGKRGDLSWNDQLATDTILGKTASMTSSKLLKNVSAWYQLEWEDDNGD